MKVHGYVRAFTVVMSFCLGSYVFAAEESIFTVTAHRSQGKPVPFTQSFTVPRGVEAPFRVFVVNGKQDGSSRASSATIELNGSRIIRANDFSQNVSTIERQVTLEATNTLTVEVRSGSDAFITVTVLGQRVGPADQILERVAAPVGSSGGSVALAGFAVVTVPEQPARPPLTLTLEKIAVETAPPMHAIPPGTEEIWLEGIKITSSENITSTMAISVTIPTAFLERMPPGRTVELFAEMTQLGTQDEALKSYQRLRAKFDPATAQASASIPARAFTPTNSVQTVILVGTYLAAPAVSVVTISNVQPSDRIEVRSDGTFPVSAHLSFTLPDKIRNPLGSGTLSASDVTSKFGPRVHPKTGQDSFHYGLDIRTDRMPVYATASGTVIYSGPQRNCTDWESPPTLPLLICKTGWGHVVMVAHDGGRGVSRYGHLWPLSMADLGRIEQGGPIGISDTSGAVTGPHLHLEYLWDGFEVDPWLFLDQQDVETYLGNQSVVLSIGGQPVADSRVAVKASLEGTKGVFDYATVLDLANLGFQLGVGEHKIDINIETTREKDGIPEVEKLSEFTLSVVDEPPPTRTKLLVFVTAGGDGGSTLSSTPTSIQCDAVNGEEILCGEMNVVLGSNVTLTGVPKFSKECLATPFICRMNLSIDCGESATYPESLNNIVVKRVSEQEPIPVSGTFTMDRPTTCLVSFKVSG